MRKNCDSRPPNRAGRFHTAPLVHRKPRLKSLHHIFGAGHPSSVWEPAAVLHPLNNPTYRMAHHQIHVLHRCWYPIQYENRLTYIYVSFFFLQLLQKFQGQHAVPEK